MNFTKSLFLIVSCGLLMMSACTKPKTTTANLIFKFKYDSTQTRLDGFGNPTGMPAGHGGQNPHMNVMSAHYIELAPSAYTALGTGAKLYSTPMTTAGGTSAIDFSQEILTADGGTVFSVPLDQVPAGVYQYLRVSLAYQNYDVQLYEDTVISGYHVQQSFPCTVASFIGVNTYITNYKVKTETLTVNGNREQGYWGFESIGSVGGYPFNYLTYGQAPAGATTVVNPLFATSPIPAGSCVATGQFVNGNAGSLTITGQETKDIVVTISLSVNKSFEWVETGTPDGRWEPGKGEYIVDMGVRGLIPYVQQ